MTNTALSAKSRAGAEDKNSFLQHNFSIGGMYVKTQNDGD